MAAMQASHSHKSGPEMQLLTELLAEYDVAVQRAPTVLRFHCHGWKYTGHGHCSDDCAYTNARKRRHPKNSMQHNTMAGNIHYTLSNQATSGLMLITDPVSVAFRPSGSSITRQCGGVRTETP